jgi:AcrR family transcriptional regulator
MATKKPRFPSSRPTPNARAPARVPTRAKPARPLPPPTRSEPVLAKPLNARGAAASRAPRAESPEERKAALRRAAFACFAEAGFHATTVDDICKHAGVSKGTFYWYFESKEQVFVEILEVWANEVEGEILAQFRDAFEGADPERALLLALGREGRRGRRLLPVWFDALVQSQRHPELKAALSVFLRRMRRALAQVLAPTFGHFYGPDEIQTLSGLILSSFVGSIAQQMAEPDEHLYDDHSRALLSTVEHFGRLLMKERLDAKPAPRRR